MIASKPPAAGAGAEKARKMTFEKIDGLVAAVNTPMNADGSIRLALVEKQAGMLVRNGVVGAFVCGTAGESLSLTTQERMDLAERWVQAAGGKLKVIVHVGHDSIKDCTALAAHAQQIRAWGIGAMPPCFFRPAGADDLAAFCAEAAAAAPSLPFYYYHIPTMTGVNVSIVDFFRAASSRIANLAGVKFTYEDLMDFALAMEFDGGRYDMLFGRDELLICGLALGARGAIGSTFNYAAPLYLKLIAAFEAGDLTAARRLQRKSMHIIDCFRCKQPSPMPYNKAIMRLVGLDLGPVRPPLVNLTEGQFESFKAQLEAAGFHVFCCK